MLMLDVCVTLDVTREKDVFDAEVERGTGGKRERVEAGKVCGVYRMNVLDAAERDVNVDVDMDVDVGCICTGCPCARVGVGWRGLVLIVVDVVCIGACCCCC